MWDRACDESPVDSRDRAEGEQGVDEGVGRGGARAFGEWVGDEGEDRAGQVPRLVATLLVGEGCASGTARPQATTSPFPDALPSAQWDA
jgi:hypothetical protein